MSISDVLVSSAWASLWFSWVAGLLVCLPTLAAFAIASHGNRLRYLIGGFLGGFAGECCGVTSLFLSSWFSCRTNPSCNTAQGDMGLILSVPAGSLLGCILGICWVWLMQPTSLEQSQPVEVAARSRVTVWTTAVGVPVVLWFWVTILLAWIMA
jgi:hypothetical protein